MTDFSIVIPVAAYREFDPSVRRAIMSYVMNELGATTAKPTDQSTDQGRDDQGLAKLEVADAKAFLNNCSDKTIAILREIVGRDGYFLSSEIATSMGTSTGELRGAWSGLTKRVRTITKDADAQLLGWFKQGDSDWQGVMAAKTLASMRIALNERG